METQNLSNYACPQNYASEGVVVEHRNRNYCTRVNLHISPRSTRMACFSSIEISACTYLIMLKRLIFEKIFTVLLLRSTCNNFAGCPRSSPPITSTGPRALLTIYNWAFRCEFKIATRTGITLTISAWRIFFISPEKFTTAVFSSWTSVITPFRWSRTVLTTSPRNNHDWAVEKGPLALDVVRGAVTGTKLLWKIK